MKKIKTLLTWISGILIVLVISGIAYIKFALPDVGEAPDLVIEQTPARIARGKYLATHVTVCIDCHSQRDWSRFSGPLIESTMGQGGELFDQKLGFPGAYYSSNITPSGISRYTDGELFRVITTGVNKEGKALFPIMPYQYYGQMDPEDIKCIIAYIRTLRPIENKVLPSKSDFPMNLIINTIPVKAQPTKLPEKSDIVNYGKYLTNAATCMECHTQVKGGKLIVGMEFAGGREFPFPDGTVIHSTNLTPDTETGIGEWTNQMFLDLFHSRSDSITLHSKLEPGNINTMMPWTLYGRMTDEDLNAIFSYLKTLKPIRNRIELNTKTVN
ncbi:MAG: cytochrome c [Bacteroidia bacterium]|nr:c-type cytochrome [Bacteroidia bacterium]MCZ2276853.1 cytochrome c [Bacteroidia bacterium]